MGNSSSYDKPAEVTSKYFPDFVKTLPSLKGKTIAITGCTTGTGYICARTCCELGASVIMLNRPSKRADEALQKLKDAGHKDVSLVECDLQSFASVKKASSELQSKLKETGLDVLVNNAGIMATVDKATGDGCDDQMQTNHLSHFLLTAGVWSLLGTAQEKRGDARVVNHSSGARSTAGGKKIEEKYFGKNGGNLGGDEGGPWYSPFSGERWVRYQQTKLANVVFTYALRDRAEKAGSKVKSLCAHPGLSATNLQVKSANDGGMGVGFTGYLMSWVSQSGEDGTMGLLAATAKSDVKSGDFFGPSSITGPAVLMDKETEEKLADKESRDMLWRASEEVTGFEFPL